MSILNGRVVRHRMAELNLNWAAVSGTSGIPEGTLKNTTRYSNPDPISLPRAGALLSALNPPGHQRRGLSTLRLEDILEAERGDGVPDEPPSKDQEPETNTGPGREGGNKGRGGKDTKGPRRLKGAA